MREVAVHDVVAVGRLGVAAGLLSVQIVEVRLQRARGLGERLRQLTLERGAQEAEPPAVVWQEERARVAEPLLAYADGQLLLGRMQVVQNGQFGECRQWSVVACWGFWLEVEKVEKVEERR